MKKIVAFMLTILLVFGVVTTVAAEEPVTNTDAENPYSTLNLVKQLRENPLVEDIWVPVLSDDCSIKSMTFSSNGSYSFNIVNSKYIIGIVVSIINGKPIASYNDEKSPYQMLLAENGLPMGTVTQESATQVATQRVITIAQYLDDESHKHYKRFEYLDIMNMGTYQGYPAVSFAWHLYNKRGNLLDPNDTYIIYETLLALTPDSVASVMCDHGVYDGRLTTENLQSRLARQTDLKLVTTGDVDLDYKVNAKDALAILKHGVKKQMLTDELAVLLADCDKNDTIDAKDALLTLRKAVFK